MQTAFCPICGQATIQAEIDGRLRNTCQTGHFTQFAMVAMSAGALIYHEDSVLLVQLNHPSKPWALPGGYLEQDETLIDCIIREVKEETGLSVTPKGIIAMRELVKADRNEFYVIFLAKPTDDNAISNFNPDEILDARFIKLDELDQYNITDFAKRIIRGYRDKQPELLEEFTIPNYNMTALMFGNL